MSTDEFNKKIQKAIDSNLVGEIIFSDEEMEQLRKSIPYFTHPYSYVDLPNAEKIFIYITNLTKAMEYDDGTHDNDWRSHVDPYLSFSDASATQTRIYDLLNKVFELLNGKVFYVPKDPVDKRKRYYGTFMANALMPKGSMFAFFDICYNDVYKGLMEYVYYDNESVYTLFAEAFKNSIKYELSHIKSSNVTLESRAYLVKGGLRYLSLYDSKRMAKLFQEVIYLFSILDSPEEFSDDNYLHQLVLEWYEQKLDLPELSNRINSPRERKEIKKDLTTPNVHFKFNSNNNSLYLCISSFLITYSGDPHDIDLKFTIYNDNVPVKGPENLAVNLQSFMLRTTDYEICISNLINGSLDKLSLVITFNGRNIYDSRTANQNLARDFMIFPMKKSDDALETRQAILPPDYYYAFISNAEALLTNRPSSFERVEGTDSVYIINPKNGELLSSEHNKVLFLEQKEFLKPGFDVTKNEATYIYKEEDYEIIETLCLSLDIDANLCEYSLAFFDMTSSSTKPIKTVSLSKYMAYDDSDNGCQIICVDEDIPIKVPYKVCLYKGLDIQHGTFTNVIFIPNFSIRYLDGELCFKDSINFRIFMNGEEPIDCVEPTSGEVRAEFLDGILVLNNPAIFKIKIGDGDYKLLDEIETEFFYKDISSSDTISFLPSNMNFVIAVSGGVKFEPNNFGTKIYSLANNKSLDTAKIHIFYSDKFDNLQCIATFIIHYKPHFAVLPIIQVKEDDAYKIYWDPHSFIGDKKSHFRLRFENIPSKRKGYSIKIDDTFSLEKKEIDSSSLSYRKYHCVAVVSEGLFDTHTTEVHLGDFTYGDAGLIQLGIRKIFDQCICSTGMRLFRSNEPDELQYVLSQEYAVADSVKVVLSDGDVVYKANLYNQDGTRIDMLGGQRIKSVVWKYDEEDSTKILLRYELKDEEYEEFCDYEQFIVFRYNKRISILSHVQPKIKDFDILEAVYFRREE